MEARPISKVAVVGGGLMGSGISTSLLVTGHSVLVREIDEAQCNAAKDRIVGNLKRSVKGGRMTEAEAETCISNLSTTTTFEPMADRDLVIESVIEKMDIKQSVFQAVADVVDEGCVMATNTSTMDITEVYNQWCVCMCVCEGGGGVPSSQSLSDLLVVCCAQNACADQRGRGQPWSSHWHALL